MVLFSLSVTGMNQGVMISSRQGRTQRSSSEIPGEGGTEESEPRRRRSKQPEESEEEKKCCSKCVCKPIDADTIDIYARAVFPFTFAVVNVIYWVAYTMWGAGSRPVRLAAVQRLYIRSCWSCATSVLSDWCSWNILLGLSGEKNPQKKWGVTTCECGCVVINGSSDELAELHIFKYKCRTGTRGGKGRGVGDSHTQWLQQSRFSCHPVIWTLSTLDSTAKRPAWSPCSTDHTLTSLSIR